MEVFLIVPYASQSIAFCILRVVCTISKSIVTTLNSGFSFSCNDNRVITYTTGALALFEKGKIASSNINVPAPDYVLEKDYNLLSVKEIKSYISCRSFQPCDEYDQEKGWTSLNNRIAKDKYNLDEGKAINKKRKSGKFRLVINQLKHKK